MSSQAKADIAKDLHPEVAGDVYWFGFLFALAGAFTFFGSQLPIVADSDHSQLATVFLGGATLPAAFRELCTKIRMLRTLRFLEGTYRRGLQLPGADDTLANILISLLQPPSMRSARPTTAMET